MKKFNFLPILFVVALFGFSSCSDDDETVIDNLTGTKWKYVENSANSIFLNFYTETTGQCIITINNDPDAGQFTYNYNKPNIKIYVNGNSFMTGSIKGNKMDVTLANNSGSFALIKQ